MEGKQACLLVVLIFIYVCIYIYIYISPTCLLLESLWSALGQLAFLHQNRHGKLEELVWQGEAITHFSCRSSLSKEK